MINLLIFFFRFFHLSKVEKEDDKVIKKKKKGMGNEIRDFEIFYAFLPERKYGLV